MAVSCELMGAPLPQGEFQALDHRVTGRAFEIHNTLGRFCDEAVYRSELARRCFSQGMPVHEEMVLKVTHGAFARTYYMDLVVQDSAVYELKAVERLVPAHEAQLLNYLLLAGQNHGKLINFRPSSVETRFVSTSLSLAKRRRVKIMDTEFNAETPFAGQLRRGLTEMLDDLGAFLEIGLYRECLLFLLPECLGPTCVDLRHGGGLIGTQRMCLLDANSSWHLSAITEGLASYETHLRRLLRLTSLSHMHWINLSHQTVHMATIRK